MISTSCGKLHDSHEPSWHRGLRGEANR
jgi:hypothetical protein